MRVLLTAFKGTSSEKLIRCFDDTYNKLILINSKETSVKQLYSVLSDDYFDYIISLGQKPVIRDKIYIETQGRLKNSVYKTYINIDRLVHSLTEKGLCVRLSQNAGTSFCNHIYANGLKLISQLKTNTKMVFVHIPFNKNISNFDEYSNKLIQAIITFVSGTEIYKN